jgi:hypothetical protein
MALASLFPTTLARLCWLGFARLSSLAMCAGWAGGFFFSRVEDGGVVRFHASSLLFLPVAEMATDGNGPCGLLRRSIA